MPVPKKPFALVLTILLYVPAILSAGQDEIKNFRVAYVPNVIAGVSPHDTELAFNILLEKIMNQKLPGYGTKAISYGDMSLAIKDFTLGKIDLLAMTSLHYLEAHKNVQMEPAIVSVSGGVSENSYLLIVQKANDFQSLDQLRGKKLIIEKGIAGDIATLWMDTLLLEQGLPESSMFFSSVKKVNKVSQALLPVFFGQMDLCIIRKCSFETMTDLNPQLGRELLCKRESPGYLFTIGVLNPRLGEKYRKVLSDMAVTIGDIPEGKQVLLMFQMDRFDIFKPEYLKNIENLYQRHRMLKAKYLK